MRTAGIGSSLQRRRLPPGMTLMEVLIATGILVFGMVGIIAVFNTAIQSHIRAIDETTAGMVAGTVMADLRGLFARGIEPPAKPPKKDKRGNPAFEELAAYESDPQYRYAVSIVDLNPKRSLKDQAVFGKEYYVEVTVFWRSEGDNDGHSYSAGLSLAAAAGRAPGAELTCIDCHTAAWQDDDVLTPALSLRAAAR